MFHGLRLSSPLSNRLTHLKVKDKVMLQHSHGRIKLFRVETSLRATREATSGRIHVTTRAPEITSPATTIRNVAMLSTSNGNNKKYETNDSLPISLNSYAQQSDLENINSPKNVELALVCGLDVSGGSLSERPRKPPVLEYI